VSGPAEYWRFTQPALASIAEQAIAAHGITGQQAQIWEVLGGIAYDRSDHDGARGERSTKMTSSYARDCRRCPIIRCESPRVCGDFLSRQPWKDLALEREQGIG
jgi:hypothetical protein